MRLTALPAGLEDLHQVLPEGNAQAVLMELARVFFPDSASASAADREEPDLQARYQTLVEQIPAVVFMAPLMEGIGEAYVSPQIETMLGFTQEEWLCDPVLWYTQLHPQDKTRWSEEAAQLFLSGEPLKSVYRVIARDGHTVWFHCEAKMVRRPDGRPWFLHGVGFDITELKQAGESLQKANDQLESRVQERTRELAETNIKLERSRLTAEAANRAKSEFLANMSHEIRTPMNGVLGMTELVLGTDLNTDQREQLKLVKASAESLLSVINNILDLSKIEAGMLELDPVEFSLRANIEEITNLFSIPAQQKGLTVVCEIDRRIPRIVVADASRIRQVLVNLIGNAVKFTQHGAIQITVRFGPRGISPSGALELEFSVRDEGIGVPLNAQQHIFQAFSQADGSMTRKYGGTGLGLTISKQLVEMMGGQIWLESVPGKGSTFHFTVKAERGKQPRHSVSSGMFPESQPVVPHCPNLAATLFAMTSAISEQRGAVSILPPGWHLNGPREKSTSHGLRILLAEDNRVNQLIAKGLLTKKDNTVVTAENGREALEAWTREAFDLILMDVQMPEMNGFEATMQIRENEKTAGGHIPIIALTANALRGDREKCLAAGMDDYVSKPFNSEELLAAMDRVMAAHSPR